MEQIFVGLMSGTSIDSIDSVLVDLGSRRLKILEKNSTKIPKRLKMNTLKAIDNESLSKKEILYLDEQFGTLFARAVLDLIKKGKIEKSKIIAIGSHGQTIKHSPGSDKPYSIQVGSPIKISKLTGIKTVADFRSKDIKEGGQGAPLTPLFHQFILKLNNLQKGIFINIGGISNLTYIDKQKNLLFGFDCGPGNCLMDSWIRSHGKGEYDESGKWASSGKVIPKLVSIMLKDQYFSFNAPKSTGPDYFSLSWLEEKISLLKETPLDEDVQATLLELTSQTIFQEIKKLKCLKENIYFCGGGIHNDSLMKNIQKKKGTLVLNTNSLGLDPDYLEATCFAWLAQQKLENKKFNLSRITGSKKPLSLGKVWSS